MLGGEGEQTRECWLPQRERKITAVPQSVGEEQFGHTKEAVVFGNTQDRLGIEFGAHHHVMVQMDAAFGKSVLPEEYSQNAASSLLVASARSSPRLHPIELQSFSVLGASPTITIF